MEGVHCVKDSVMVENIVFRRMLKHVSIILVLLGSMLGSTSCMEPDEIMFQAEMEHLFNSATDSNEHQA